MEMAAAKYAKRCNVLDFPSGGGAFFQVATFNKHQLKGYWTYVWPRHTDPGTCRISLSRETQWHPTPPDGPSEARRKR